MVDISVWVWPVVCDPCPLCSQATKEPATWAVTCPVYILHQRQNLQGQVMAGVISPLLRVWAG